MKTTTPALAALLLAGCVSFGAKPPASLLTLTPSNPVAPSAGLAATPADTITILAPSTPAAITTTRLPVYESGTAIAYVKDALWVDNPARLFQRLLAENVSARSGRIVLDTAQSTLDPGVRLTGALRSFGIDASTMQAVVTYDAVLARTATRIESRRFEARVPVTLIDAASSGSALNQAANTVATQVADWVGR